MLQKILGRGVNSNKLTYRNFKNFLTFALNKLRTPKLVHSRGMNFLIAKGFGLIPYSFEITAINKRRLFKFKNNNCVTIAIDHVVFGAQMINEAEHLCTEFGLHTSFTTKITKFFLSKLGSLFAFVSYQPLIQLQQNIFFTKTRYHELTI